jgi:hypothetical protein
MYSDPFSLWYRFASALVSRNWFGKSALLPESDHGIGKGTANRRERPSDLIQADVVMGRFCPLFRREVSREVLGADGRIADGNGNLLALFKLYVF